MNIKPFIIGLVVFLAFSLLIQTSYIQAIDEQIILYGEHLRNTWLTNIMIFFTTVGSIKVTGPLTIIISVYFIWKKKWLEFIFVYINLYSVRTFNRFLKDLFHRERPDLNRIIDVGELSFPSGHAMNSTAIYGFFIYLWINRKPGQQGNRFSIIATILLVFLIGVSRVYIGVHYVTDILAGFAAGGVWLFVVVTIFQLIRRKLSFFKRILGKKI